MKAVPINEFPKRCSSILQYGKNQRIINEFMESSDWLVELKYESGEYKNPYNCRECFKISLKRLNLWEQVGVSTINGRVVMYKRFKLPQGEYLR